MGRLLTKEEWIKRNKLKNRLMSISAFVLFAVIIVSTGIFVKTLIESSNTNIASDEVVIQTLSNGIQVKVDFLSPNPYSRPQTELKKVNGIVIHYVGNPSTTAMNNRNYFESLAKKKTTSASSHFVIGLEGEVIQCIPLTEIAYASNERNADTISIECCHPDDMGKFNEATYDSLVSLVAKLCVEYDLKEDEVIRHYDVTGKKCPLYYVDHEDAWIQLKADIFDEIELVKEELENAVDATAE
ncbi:MAG: N-acetylmuramoyl-L-alanine amidase [Herbinix sp.]|jgi:hypothetical protein|nr:N-acetylmuramoyl-L-alanine amidase [Herbinix sp.]